MWRTETLLLLLLSLTVFLPSAQAVSLIQALQNAGASEFATELQKNSSTFAMYLNSNQVQTIFAPLDGSSNTSSLRLKRDLSAFANIIYQSTSNTNTLAGMSARSGIRMNSNYHLSNSSKKPQVFVSNPLNSTKNTIPKRWFSRLRVRWDTTTELVTVPTTVLVTVPTTVSTTLTTTLNITETTTEHTTLNITIPTTLTTTLNITIPTTEHTTLNITYTTTVPTTVDVLVTTTVHTTLDVTITTTVPTTVTTTLDVSVPTTVVTTLDITVTTIVPTTVDVPVTITVPTTVSTTLRITVPTTVSTTVDITVPTTLLTTVQVTVPTTLVTTVQVTVPTTLVTTVQVTVPTTVPTTVDITVPTTVVTTVYVTVEVPTVVLTSLPITPTSVLKIFSGLGNNVKVVQGDIAYDGGGLIHIVDGYFTLPESLTDTAKHNNHTTFTNLISSSNLTDNLNNADVITCFVPNNAAFDTFYNATGNYTGNNYSTTADMILAHTINGSFLDLPALSNGPTYTTQAGTTIVVTTIGGSYFINGAQIIAPNQILENGVCHVVDKVIQPIPNPTPVSFKSSASSLNGGPIQFVIVFWGFLFYLAAGILL